eukprot:g20112.t1
MPDIQLTVHKTLVQANRCHVGKVEEQVKACEAKIQEITSRLSQNESAIQSAMADVRGVSEKVTAAVASAKQVVALTSQAEACNPRGPPEEVVVRVFKKGILLKQGKYFGSWRKLFFVLDGNCLEHYPSTQAYMSGVPATKKIILSGRGCLSYTKYSQCFSVSNGDRTTWTMMAENNEEFDEWMTGLRTVMGALFDDRISRVTTAKSPRASKR